MTDLRKAAEMALEALEAVTKEMLALRDELAELGGRPATNVLHQSLWDSSHTAYADKAIPAAIALREALEQPVDNVDMSGERVHKTEKSIHEPVAWMKSSGLVSPYKHGSYQIPLYTAPPEEGCAHCGKQASDGWALYCVECKWVGLTDEEKEYFKKLGMVGVEIIESKLKERNS